jgi:putative Mg2+ transporter-C (MgtC) family protein
MSVVHLSGRERVALLLSLAASYFLALPLGWERRARSQSHFGVRVFPLVSVSSCAYLFLGQQLFTGKSSTEQADILQGLMTGIGFVGAGAIMKERGEARGVATAAAIWTTGGIGASVAYGYYVVAAALSALSLFIVVVSPQRAAAEGDSERRDDTKADGA